MTGTVFSGTRTPLVGEVRVPGDKSISHRALLFSAAAEGTSHLSGVLDSADCRSTLSAIQALGAKAQVTPEAGGTLGVTVTGWGAEGPTSPSEPLDCGNSGTTTRLLLGLLSGYPVTAELVGDQSLSRRPMKRVIDPLSQTGAVFQSEEGHLPVKVTGSEKPAAIRYTSPVASAQVKTAVLLAGLGAQGTTAVTEPHLSRDHTERMLPAFGVPVERDGLTVSLTGPARLHPCDVEVPGDPSSAAFLLAAAAAVPGSNVTVKHVSLNPTRLGFLKVMRRMGAHIKVLVTGNVGSEELGDITVIGDSKLQGTIVPADEIASLIDEIPVLALLASFASGETRFSEAGELRVKESDRFAAIVEGLGALGCGAFGEGDDLVICGGQGPAKDAVLPTYHDHRLALTWCLAALCSQVTVELDDFACCKVSYPLFLEDIEKLSKQP